MEEVIKNYLMFSYQLSLDTYTSYKLRNKISGDDEYLQHIFVDIKTIFVMEDDVIDEIWDSWFKPEIVKFENKLVDIKYSVYEKTGLTLNL
jgi:hypothetical protein